MAVYLTLRETNDYGFGLSETLEIKATHTTMYSITFTIGNELKANGDHEWEIKMLVSYKFSWKRR